MIKGDPGSGRSLCMISNTMEECRGGFELSIESAWSPTIRITRSLVGKM